MMCSFAASVRHVAWEARLVIGAAGACRMVLLAAPLPAGDAAIGFGQMGAFIGM